MMKDGKAYEMNNKNVEDIILKAEGLSFSYDNEATHSLNDLSLEIRRGSKVAFMGANGSGKSTFFLCCNGIHRPTAGTLFLDGQPLDYSRKGLLQLRSKVGIIFQDPDIQLFSASVYQEISFGILNLGIPEEEAKAEVEKVIDYLEITPFRHKPTHALSGGQKKQVSIADILVMHPEIIILDEPAAALDPKHTTMVNQIVDQLTANGITVLMSTHDVNYALEWADEIALFHEGRLLMQGTPLEVFSNQSALAMTNLEQPAVLQLFESLCKKGILSAALPLPTNLKMLESYIEEISEKPHYGGSLQTARETKRAILTVSFGTSFGAARRVAIDAIERDIAAAFPEYGAYSAWTCKKILAKRDAQGVVPEQTRVPASGAEVSEGGADLPTASSSDAVVSSAPVYSVREAMEAMAADGITDVIVQPTHVINGIENDQMKADALIYQEYFHSIRFGDPLLTARMDSEAVIQAVAKEFTDLEADEALVLMGHGTTHYSNAAYAALDYGFKDSGHPNIYVGTAEAGSTMKSLIHILRGRKPKRVILAPFMIVAGLHAHSDMDGENADSWRCQLERAGFEVTSVLRGLGEYPGIRRLFISHIRDTIKREEERVEIGRIVMKKDE